MNFNYITVAEYGRFIDSTQYVSDVDLIQGNGSLVAEIRLNYGRSDSVPIHRLSYRDALEFASWANMRIPNEEELESHFTELVQAMQPVKWHFYCWTNTEVSGRIVVLHGPYFFDRNIIAKARMTVNPNYLDEFEPIALRLCG